MAFLVHFTFTDAMAYVSLFLSMRSGDWALRMASVKSMAPIFTAFDHPVYQKLISTHLADLLTMPAAIQTMFQQGAFVISLNERPWHSVGIDECHEMTINKDCKSSIVRPLPDYINRLAHYMPYRPKAVKNLKQQVLPTTEDRQTSVTSPFPTKPDDIKSEQNIQAQIKSLNTNHLLAVSESNRGLINPFTQKHATASQHHDLLNFRDVGQKEFLLRIASVILKQPSVHAPNRRKRLQTFTERTIKKSRVSQLEKDRRLILSALKKKMHHSMKTGRPIDNPCEQLIEYPLAISDSNGSLLKGHKSYTTRFLSCRYKEANPRVLVSNMPWRPECSVLDGMFLINTSPLGGHKTFVDYGKFLLTRYIMTQFSKGSNEVHVVFDNPGRLKNTPKYFEHLRRDALAAVIQDHCCDELLPNTQIPKKWRENLLNCRRCKRGLVTFLCGYFLKTIRTYLQSNQILYLAGGFDGDITDTVWYVQGDSQPQQEPEYTCNAEEADSRVWLHIQRTAWKHILLVSPDADVYHIGLGLDMGTTHVLVQVSPIHSRKIHYIDMRALTLALANDPDLAGIPSCILPQVFQTLFVCSGCDYTSFFSQLGKATFVPFLFPLCYIHIWGRATGYTC